MFFNFSTGPPLAKASGFQACQDDCLSTISRVAFSGPGFCDFPGAPALKKSLAIRFVQGVDFREIPMENEPLFPGRACVFSAKVPLWPFDFSPKILTDFCENQTGIFRSVG